MISTVSTYMCRVSAALLLVFIITSQASSEGLLPHLTDGERAYLDSKPYLTMVCDPQWPPFDFIDSTGKHAGMSADYLKILSHRLGKTIRLIPTGSWTESMRIARDGEVDLVSFLNESPDRSNFLNFSEPFFSNNFVIVGRKREWKEYTLDSLSGKAVAVVRGYVLEEKLRRNQPGIRIVSAQDGEECLAMIERGEVFATVMTLLEAKHFIRKDFADALHIIGETPDANQPRIGIRKQDALLTSIIQKAVLSLTESDKHMVRDLWIADKGSYQFSMKWVLYGVAILIFIAVLYWYQKARRFR